MKVKLQIVMDDDLIRFEKELGVLMARDWKLHGPRLIKPSTGGIIPINGFSPTTCIYMQTLVKGDY